MLVAMRDSPDRRVKFAGVRRLGSSGLAAADARDLLVAAAGSVDDSPPKLSTGWRC